MLRFFFCFVAHRFAARPILLHFYRATQELIDSRFIALLLFFHFCEQYPAQVRMIGQEFWLGDELRNLSH